MSETSAASAGAASAPSPASAASTGSESASAGAGHAPGVGGDASTGEGAAGSIPPVAAPAKYRFGGREYDSQKHAEDSIAAQIGRVPSVQRENAQLKTQLADLTQQVTALRALVGPGATSQPGQGAPGKDGAAPSTLEQRLLQDGTFEFWEESANDPNIGLKGVLLDMVRTLEGHVGSKLEEVTGRFDALDRRNEGAQRVARGFNVVGELIKNGYPELDETNQSEEAQEAQQYVLEFLGQFPEGVVGQNPEFYIRGAIDQFRRERGVPVFAQPPGSSGSPSAILAAAAEGGAPSATPIDGHGTPRPGNGKESSQDRIRRENRQAASRSARTPSGRPLGFEVSSE